MRTHRTARKYPTKGMNKNLKRCPKCKSSKIYKRVRALQWSANAKGKRESNIEKFEKLSKIYFCQMCGHEFDTPLVLIKVEESLLNEKIIEDGKIIESGKMEYKNGDNT